MERGELFKYRRWQEWEWGSSQQEEGRKGREKQPTRVGLSSSEGGGPPSQSGCWGRPAPWEKAEKVPAKREVSKTTQGFRRVFRCFHRSSEDELEGWGEWF